MNNERKNILIISLSDLKKDARVKRQIIFLDNYNLTVAGYADPCISGVKYYKILNKETRFLKTVLSLQRILRMYSLSDNYTLKYKIKFEDESIFKLNFDLIIANDFNSLPLAFSIGEGEKILFDAHEYSPEEFNDILLWKLLKKKYIVWSCKKYLPLINSMTTVSSGIADRYEKEFGIKPKVVTNAAQYVKIEPMPVNNKNIKIIHHGAAMPSRHIELMIDIMKYADKRFTLDLLLLNTNAKYYNKLVKSTLNLQNVKIIKPLPGEKIVGFINKYDIGIYLLPPINFNHDYALPNKIFDFIQARLCIFTGPSKEISKLVNDYKIGIVTSNFDSLKAAETLNSLTSEKIFEFKNNQNRAASVLSSESNKNIFLSLVESILK